MNLPSRLQKKPGMGRLVSAVTSVALSNGSSVFLTQTLRVLFHGFTKAMYLPSGEICAPEISGSPKNNSLSSTGRLLGDSDRAGERHNQNKAEYEVVH